MLKVADVKYNTWLRRVRDGKLAVVIGDSTAESIPLAAVDSRTATYTLEHLNEDGWEKMDE